MLTLLVWGRPLFLGALCALVASYVWVLYKTRHE
jgi:hypothetical protein